MNALTLTWIITVSTLIAVVVFDFVVFHRRPHAINAREALGWTGVYVLGALLFAPVLYALYESGVFAVEGEPAKSGFDASIEYITAYLVEESLSLDNLFVMAAIFSFLNVATKYQHRVLFLGILGAILLRGVAIGLGIAFVQQFDWVLYVFAGLLLIAAAKLLFSGDDEPDLEKNLVLRLLRRFVNITNTYHEQRFFVRIDGKLFATPLVVALVLIETSDIVFAVDSIPAVFGVTLDPYIVFTSNMFAILGLRSIYFALSALLSRFHLLRYSLALVLGFVAVKMAAHHHFKITPWLSLVVIALLLAGGIAASLLVPKKGHAKEEPKEESPTPEPAGRESTPP
jgi:tellurite resistance protein TerC